MQKEFDELQFLRDAVKIDSSESVEEFRVFILETLSDNGVEAEVDDTGNLIASKGSGQPHLVLHSHMDTVEPNLEFGETDEEIRVEALVMQRLLSRSFSRP